MCETKNNQPRLNVQATYVCAPLPFVAIPAVMPVVGFENHISLFQIHIIIQSLYTLDHGGYYDFRVKKINSNQPLSLNHESRMISASKK